MAEKFKEDDKIELQNTYPAAKFYEAGYDKSGTIVREEQNGFVVVRPDPPKNVPDIPRSDITVRTEHIKPVSEQKSVDGFER